MNKEEILSQIAECVEFGKVNRIASYPPEMRGKDGADELTMQALELGIPPSEILNRALIVAMERVGQKFADKKIFVPQMLISAKAMNTALIHLKPFFISGEVKRRGCFIVGTVTGDLHDIGKNLVAMMVEGSGWEVIDLGVDAGSPKFIHALNGHAGAVIGLSALLTTTMVNMRTIVKDIKQYSPNTQVIIGGAPVSESFRMETGADAYARDPQGAVNYLNSL